MVTTKTGQRAQPEHTCRFLRQSPDDPAAARCEQCRALYGLTLVHELAHACLLDMAGAHPGSCLLCTNVYEAHRA